MKNLSSKNICIQKKIKDKMSLMHDTSHKEFDMDEALEYCFGFMRDTAKTWKSFKTKPEKMLPSSKI